MNRPYTHVALAAPIPHLHAVKQQHAAAAGEQVLPEQNAVVVQSEVALPPLTLLGLTPDSHPPADCTLQVWPQQQQRGDRSEEDGSCKGVQRNDESRDEVCGEVAMETGER